MKTDEKTVENILLIDDDEELAGVLAQILGRPDGIGYNVTVANNGLDGLNCMHGLRGGERPDIILLDLVMPDLDGSGFMVAKNSDCLVRDIPVIIVTATDIDSSWVKQIKGAQRILHKPYELYQVLEEIMQVHGPTTRGLHPEVISQARLIEL